MLWCNVLRMTNPIKSEDGLTHDWNRSDPDEWHDDTDPRFARDAFSMIALVIGVVAVLIAAVFGAPAAPVVLPMLLACAGLYAVAYTIGRRR